MFKKFLHDETTIIGLKSLGLSKTKEQEPALKKQATTTTIKTLQTQQNNEYPKNSTTSTIESSIHLNFSKQPKTLEGLFGREVKLNLNK